MIQKLLRSSLVLGVGIRYLRPRRNFVALISAISVVGAALGVGILIATVALLKGHSQRMEKSLLGFEPHMKLTHSHVMYDWYEVIEDVKEHQDVVDAIPYSHGQALLDNGNELQVVLLQGLPYDQAPEDHKGEAIYDKLAALIGRDVEGNSLGEFDLSDDYLIIGKPLAEKLKVKVGDPLSLHSLANGEQLLRAMEEDEEGDFDDVILPADLTVSGIFDSGWYEFDYSTIFIPLERGQSLYKLEYGVHGIAVETEDPFTIRQTKNDFLKMFETSPIDVRNWMDENANKLQTTAELEVIIFFLLFAIMIAAALCIANTMITITTQKRREIGIMKALGAKIDQIIGVFLIQGFAVAVAGTVLGILLGSMFLAFRMRVLDWLREVSGMEIFSAKVYNTYELHAHLTILDFVLIAAGAFLACGLSALFPAFFASRIDAARAIRNESI